MPCTCTDWQACETCQFEWSDALARSYAEAADREAQRRHEEYLAECGTCPRCGKPAYHGICGDLVCVARGVSEGTLSACEKAGMLCSICGEAIACPCCAPSEGWYPGFWSGERWCDPCCQECGLAELVEDGGEYIRVEKGKALGVSG